MQVNWNELKNWAKQIKGERGIRTLGDCEATLVFKTNALNRSATSPCCSMDFLNNINATTK